MTEDIIDDQRGAISWRRNKALKTAYIKIEEKLVNLTYLYPGLWHLEDVDNIVFAKHIRIYRLANLGPYDSLRPYHYVKINCNSYVISRETFDYIFQEVYIVNVISAERDLDEELKRIGLLKSVNESLENE